MMHLRVLRTDVTEHVTMGLWLVENRFECYNLEQSIHLSGRGKGAIPAGLYRVVITFSERFQRPLMLLVDVPGRSGIRVHPGNREQDTDGCLLPGRSRNNEAVVESGTAHALLQRQVQHAIDAKQDVWLSVENCF